MTDLVEKVPNRQRILDEATRLFAAHGFEGTSLSDVARAVGIRKPSVLYHFSSKDALREAVLEQLLSHWKDEFPRLLTSVETGKDRLNTALEALVGFFREDPWRARLLVRETLDNPDAVSEQMRRHIQPWSRLVTDYIRLGQHSGRVHPDLNPEAYMVQIVMLTLTTVAAGNITASILTSDAAPTYDEQLAELVRIARLALFLPRPPAGA
jgi:TetR/AcrR family transcriptional regulator